MSDESAGPISVEEIRQREAADRVREGEVQPVTTAGDRALTFVKKATRQFPVQALAIAFLAGAIFARRRR